MITASQIKQKSERKYNSYLASLVDGESIFPLTIISDKKPSGSIADLQKEIKELMGNAKSQKRYGYSVELKQVSSRKFGKQSLPSRIYFESKTDYLRFLHKEQEVESFKENLTLLREYFPELEQWLTTRFQMLIEYENRWPDILKVCRYFKENPRPHLYIRELPISVHTKFIEQHAGIIDELLQILIHDHCLPDEKQFEKRYHLKYAEPFIRFKLLDEAVGKKWFSGLTDLAVPVSAFNNFRIPVSTVIVVENKTTLYTALTLPEQKDAMAVFGSGFKVENLKDASWLRHANIIYWGDLDVHGFQILSQMRTYFPQTQSVMMDKNTFDQFYENGKGTPTQVAELPNLTEQEDLMYCRLHEGNYRLEQEKIPHTYVIEYMNKKIK